MAVSFARPDPSSPASVADAMFGTGRRGFDQAEVRDFLRMVAAELGRLQERERFLERELRTAQTNPDRATVELDEQTLTRMLGEETARVLTTARESAAEIRQKAEQSAASLLSEASDEASRVREEADVEAARRRSDAAADAEAELSMAKQQGREMVNEARAYRERVLSELARRRELAREQIEQLLHGRDRLMQSFERARLVAVDVVAELQPMGEPDEYVNLAPTTGPVPVMLPNEPRPVASDPVDVADAIDTVDAVVEADAVVEELVVDDGPIDALDEAAAEDAVADVSQAPELAADDEAVEDPAAEDGDEVLVGEAELEEADHDEAELDDVEHDEVEHDGADHRDDVVVDLFARLRADTTPVERERLESEPVDSAPDDSVDDASEAEATPFDQRDADLTPLIVAGAKKLKRVLADEQNEVLDTLRRREPVRVLEDLLAAAADHLGRYRDAIAADLLAAANAGAAMATLDGTLKKADADKATEAADEVLDEWLIVPLRERLERCVSDGGGDNVSIAKRVRSVYREWKTRYIDEQLDDVMRTAYGRGTYAAIPTGSPVMWVADPLHTACADCNDNTLAGALAAGDTFPTGHVFAPAHVGCRCLLLPADR